MKLFNFELTTLKSKLYAIVFASFVVRVVAFFALPNTPSALGPDEGTYGRAANWVALSKPVTDFPEYGAGLYVSGKAASLVEGYALAKESLESGRAFQAFKKFIMD
jgi:hypothetical protein